MRKLRVDASHFTEAHNVNRKDVYILTCIIRAESTNSAVFCCIFLIQVQNLTRQHIYININYITCCETYIINDK